jgi:hypothetical protein
MADALDLFLDEPSAAAVGRLRARLARAGLPAARDTPSVRFARAAVIPESGRRGLAEGLSRLVLPELWLSVLGTILTERPVLVLAAVTDTELLAAHTDVHDVLAGRVRQPSAAFLPGSWLPHCPLSGELPAPDLPRALDAVLPVEPIRARVASIGITDTRTGAVLALRAS